MNMMALRVAARFTKATALPSSLALAFLRKATKGLKGTINLTVVEEVFGLLEGNWTVKEGIGALNLTDSSHVKFVLKDFCAKHDCDVWGYAGVKEPKEFWFKTKEQAEAALPALKAVAERAGPKGPASPKADQLYIAKIDEDITQDFAQRWRIVVVGVWYGRPAYTVTTPAGAMQFVLDFRADPTNLTSDRFWKLVYQSGLKDLAQKQLASYGEEAVDRVLRPSKMRDLINTGTCPVCFGNFKLTPKTRHGKDKAMPGMVLHGYKRPGTGYVHGNCFGQDWPPFELSREGTDAYIEALEGMLLKTQDRLRRLQSGEVDILTDDLSSYRNPKVVKRDETDPKLWTRLLERSIQQVDSQVRAIEFDLGQLRRALQGWKPAPLPGAGLTL